ncbi:MAG: hypothetical protein QXX95_07240 [Nitrososphaerales archaeon]
MVLERIGEWSRYLTNPKIEKMLNSIKGKNLEPEYDIKIGYHYPIVEEVLGKDPNEAKKTLEELVSLGILNKYVIVKEIVCSDCGSSSLSLSLACPFCGSRDVYLNSLMEHTPCGSMGIESSFIDSSGLKLCPKCKIEIKNEEIRIVGKWFECKSCGRKLREPKLIYQCRMCKKEHTVEDVKFELIYGYSLNPKVSELLELSMKLVGSIIKVFKKKGYEIELASSVPGASGVNHVFDLLSKKGSEIIGIDFSFSSEGVDAEKVIKFFAKTFDTKMSDKSFLIAYPNLKESARNLVNLYKLKVIEIDSLDKASQILEDKLDSYLEKRDFLKVFRKK